MMISNQARTSTLDVSVAPRRLQPVAWLMLASAAACTAPEGEAAVEADEDEGAVTTVSVQFTTLAPTSFDDRVEATGALEADADATLSARAAGTLQSLLRLGTKVRKGQQVARIDPGLPTTGLRQAEALRAAAQASVGLARQTHDRQKPLYEEGVISALEFQQIQSQYAQARAQLAQAEAGVAQAREALENTRLVAPFAGVVDGHFVDPGEQVAPGSQVARVLDASTLVVKAGLPERYAADIRVGAEVEVRLPSYGLAPRTGKVRFVATAIDARTRTFDVEVAIDNPEGTLKPAMVAKLVVTRSTIDGALVAPQAAVLRDEKGLHVFVVDEEGDFKVARRRSVTIDGRSGANVVLGGVSSGDRVVTLGQTKLIDGDYVEVPKSKTAARKATP